MADQPFRSGLRPGDAAGSWRVVAALGGGGGGRVFEVVGARGERAALKWVAPEHGERRALESMLRDEARLGPRLVHPSIVRVLALERLPALDGSLALVLELMDGGSLADALRAAAGRSPGVLAAAHVGRAVCAALAFAHALTGEDGRSLDVVHRDVSPHNVMLSRRGDVKLGDFGIALGRGRAQSTRTGAIKGKLAYLAPEQASGEPVDARADLYAAGLVIAETALGRRLVESGNVAEALRRAREADVDPDGALLALPDELRAIVRRATARDPAARFASAREMGRALEAAVGDAARARAELAAWLEDLRDRPRTGALDAFLDPLDPGDTEATPTLRDG